MPYYNRIGFHFKESCILGLFRFEVQHLSALQGSEPTKGFRVVGLLSGALKPLKNISK